MRGKPVSYTLSRDLLSFYADLEKPFATKRKSKAWRELLRELDTLKSSRVAEISLPAESHYLSAFFIQELRFEPTKTADPTTDLESIDGIPSCTSRSMCCQDF